jgi:hypothetical protein
MDLRKVNGNGKANFFPFVAAGSEHNDTANAQELRSGDH